MPWNFPWSEFVKKRACRYLLQHYLGQFLKEKLTLNQLSVDLYNGRGIIKELNLDVESLNEALSNVQVPIEIVDGFIHSISVAIPWASLIQDSTSLEIHGLELTLRPKQRKEEVSTLDTMFNSMTSMTTSLQLAEECLKSEGSQQDKASQPYEGVQKFAQTIDSVLCRVQVKLLDTVIRLEHLPVDAERGVALEIRIKTIEYFDDMATEDRASDVDSPTRANTWEPAAIAHKNVQIDGVEIFADEFPRSTRSQSSEDMDQSQQIFQSVLHSPPLSPDITDEPESSTSVSSPDPVQIAIVMGQQNIRLKLKQNDSLAGPKVDLDCQFGMLHLLLAPQQLHALMELVEGISFPATSDSSSSRKRAQNKPMGQNDYHRVQMDLEKQLQTGRLQYHRSSHGSSPPSSIPPHGMMMESLDGEDVYFSMVGKPSLDMESSYSSNYSSSTNRSGTTTSSGNIGSVMHIKLTVLEFLVTDHLQRLLDDPTADVNRYHLRLAFFSLTVLHENPTSAPGDQSLEDEDNIKKILNIAKTYFEKVKLISTAGKLDLKDMRREFSPLLSGDHLRCLGKPLNIECNQKMAVAHRSLTVDGTIGMFELMECLFNRRSDVKIPEYTELLVFQREGWGTQPTNMYSSMHSGAPCVRLSLKNVQQTRGSHHLGSSPRSDITVTLGRLTSEVDMTIVDRINSLLSPERRSRSSSNFTGLSTAYNQCPPGMSQYSLSQTLDEGMPPQDQKVDLQITSSFAKLIIRFPIPDLRKGSQVDRLPWWLRNLREEVITLELSDAGFQTSYISNQSVQQFEFTCREGLGLFNIDPNKDPVPFVHISGDENEDGFNWPRMVVRCSLKLSSLLEEEGMEEPSPPTDSLNGACQFAKLDPSPFSTRKNLYGKEEMSEKSEAIHTSEEMVLPGDREEMRVFQDKAMNHTKTILEFTLPNVCAVLPDKKFFEYLYNRFCNDILLWEPTAPSPLQTQDQSLSSLHPFDLNVVTHILQSEDRFELAKSGLQYDSDSESDESLGAHYSIHENRYSKNKPDNTPKQSKMCVLLNITKGRLNTYTEHDIKDDNGVVDNQKGEILILLDDACLFAVVSYNGDPDLQYVCFQSGQADMYHRTSVDHVIEKAPIPSRTELYSPVPAHLQKYRCIYKSDPGASTKLGSSLCEPDPVDMISLAIRIKVDTCTTPKSDLTCDERIKEFVVSVGINGATLRHRVCPPKQGWFSQTLEFLDVKDFPVLGYVLPKVITELHVHLWSCAVDYRPLNLPTRAVLTAEALSVCSNIVAESPTSLLRFVLDDAALFISSKTVITDVDLRKDYVCVADMESFDLTLKSSDGKDQRFPKTDLRAATNRLNIRTCSDSCTALMALIRYFASDGDLVVEEGNSRRDSLDTMNTLLTAEDRSEEQEVDDSGLSESRIEQVHTMMVDAMKESSLPQTDTGNSEKSQNRTQMFFLPEGASHNKTIPAGIGTIMISDSVDSVTSSMMSEKPEQISDEEEFCIIDDPGLGIAPRDGEPAIRMFTTEPIKIKDNYFTQPLGKSDLLKSPNDFPMAQYRYTLKELTLVWYMYGGKDLEEPKKKDQLGLRSSSHHKWKECYKGERLPNPKIVWFSKGGPGRDPKTLMELQLTKVRLQHETFPVNTTQASRQVLLIYDVEIRDRLATSNFNKFLYQYSSELLPRQSHAYMVSVKALHTRPDPSIATEECSLRISLQPIRLNIDQDSLLFLRKFLETSGSSTPDGGADVVMDPDSGVKAGTVKSGVPEPTPVMSVDQPQTPDGDTNTKESLIKFVEIQDPIQGVVAVEREQSPEVEVDSQSNQPVFIKSFIFSPDVPIRLDYHGKTWVDEHGTLAGLLIGLARLNCSELRLKRLNYKHGLLGTEKLVTYALNEWLTDIKKNQLPSILGGVGPMYSFVQIAQGIRDLFWLPVEQYRKDGRIVRGIQRGASSFTTSTAMAVLELTNRLVQTVQYVAEVTFDMVSPGPSVRTRGTRLLQKQHNRSAQPTDLREGVTYAYIALKEGIKDTTQNIVDVATKEHEQKGMTGAVGGVLRQIAPTIVQPLIFTSEATSNILGGMRNQLRPDAKKEDEEKWRVEES
ncbi:hypothetical protein ScPMuIL_014957 [Solemya velum]